MANIDADELHLLMSFEASRTAVPDGFPELPPINSQRYINEAFALLEREHIFGKSWLLAGHMDEIPGPGCFQRWDHAGKPVLLVHTEDGQISALLNRCSHRGAPVVQAQSGRRRLLTCSYHGWSYSAKGDLIAVSSERDFQQLDKACLGLKSFKCERLGNLIFVNFDSEAPPLNASLGALSEQWAEFELGNCRLSRRDRFLVKANWKIALEANMEVYHVPTIHSKTVASVIDSRRNVNTLYSGGHGRMVAPMPSPSTWQSSRREIASVGEIGRTCTLSYNVFPNLVMPLNQYVIPPIQFWPLTPDQCIVETWTMAPDWTSDGAQVGPDMWTEENGARPNQILREDIEMSEAIQLAMSEADDRGIPLSYQEARIYFLHQHVDEVIGRERIPTSLQVPPVIGEDWTSPNEPRLALATK